MNREARRKSGINFKPIHVGDKVKINVKAIRNQNGYPNNYNRNYVEWINNNSKRFFVVKNNLNGMCYLSRDNEEIPWTFWEGHLTTK